MNEWQSICSRKDLVAGAGITALVNGEPVAIFYLPEQSPEFYAIGNYDPAGDANVLSRGIVGDIDGQIVVASPLYKHHFSLRSGNCIEDGGISVPVWDIRVESDRVYVRQPVSAATPLHQTGT